MKWFTIILVSAGIFLGIDRIFGYKKLLSGEVVDKVYTPSKEKYEPKFTPADKPGETGKWSVEHSYDPADWVIVVRNTVEIEEVRCDRKVYYDVRLNDSVKYECKCGLITGLVYKRKVVSIKKMPGK